MKRYCIVSILFLFGCMGAWQASNGAEAERASGEVVIKDAPALTATELAEILGTHVWKFHVAVPQGKTRIAISLQQQGIGLRDHNLSEGVDTGARANSEAEVVVAIVPVGADIVGADHIRIVVSANGITGESTTVNPLKGMATCSPGLSDAMGDGAFALVGGYGDGKTVKTPISSNADRLISLKIKFE